MDCFPQSRVALCILAHCEGRPTIGDSYNAALAEGGGWSDGFPYPGVPCKGTRCSHVPSYGWPKDTEWIGRPGSVCCWNKEAAGGGTATLLHFRQKVVQKLFQGLCSQPSALQDVDNCWWVSVRLMFSFSLWFYRYFTETLCEFASGSSSLIVGSSKKGLGSL